MHRAALSLIVLPVLLASSSPAAAQHALARLAECDRSDRSATFEADMRARPGVDRMQVRFALLRDEDGRWTRVRGARLGGWRTSRRKVERYVYAKTVENLPAPGAYRARVAFRWLDADGEIVDRAARRSRACRVPDPRPDLRVTGIEGRSKGFAVLLRNAGRSSAGPFAVVLGGVVRELDGLGARREAEILFDVPCRRQLEALVDPDDRVDERDESDNRLARPCPVG